MAEEYKGTDLTTVYDDDFTKRPFDLEISGEQSPKYMTGAEFSKLATINQKWKDPQFTIPSATNRIMGRDMTKAEEFGESFTTSAVDTIANFPDRVMNTVGQIVLEAQDDKNKLTQRLVKFFSGIMPQLPFVDKQPVDLANAVIESSNLFRKPYDDDVVDALDGREYPVRKWAQNVIANTTKAIKTREELRALNAQQRGVDQGAFTNKFASIAGAMAPIIAAGYGTGAITGALGAAPATASAVATGTMEVATGLDMAGQYAYDTARDYLDKTGDSDFSEFSPKDAKGLSALGYGAIGSMIEFGFGGVEPLFAQAFTKTGIENGIMKAVGKVTVGEAWEEFLQDWEEFLFRKADGTNTRTWGEVLKDSVKAALWGALLGGVTGGVVYRTQRRNIANVLTKTGLDFKDALKVADQVLDDTQKEIQAGFDSVVNISGEEVPQTVRSKIRQQVAATYEDVDLPEAEKEDAIDAITNLEVGFIMTDSAEKGIAPEENPILQGEVNQIGWFREGIPEQVADQVRALNDEIAGLRQQLREENTKETKDFNKIDDLEAKIEQFYAKLPKEVSDIVETDRAKVRQMLDEQMARARDLQDRRKVVRQVQQRALKALQREQESDVQKSLRRLQEQTRTEEQKARAEERKQWQEQRKLRKAIEKLRQDINRRKSKLPVSQQLFADADLVYQALRDSGFTDSQISTMAETDIINAVMPYGISPQVREQITERPTNIEIYDAEIQPVSESIINDAKKMADKNGYIFDKELNKKYKEVQDWLKDINTDNFIDAIFGKYNVNETLLNWLNDNPKIKYLDDVKGEKDRAWYTVDKDGLIVGDWRVGQVFLKPEKAQDISEYTNDYDEGNIETYVYKVPETQEELIDNVFNYYVERYNEDLETNENMQGAPLENVDMYSQKSVQHLLFQEPFDLADENARLDDIYPEYTGETIEVDGKERTVYNSNGDRIAKSKEALTNFWRWFGDSKVVDEQGRPLVVRHTTAATFDTFDKSKIGQYSGNYGFYGAGFYFAPTTDTFYADFAKNQMYVYLKIENPFMITPETNYDNIVEYTGNEREYDPSQDWRDNIENTIAGFEWAFSENLDESGYDGVWFKQDTSNIEIVAFEPNQIKSVDNRGTYSPDTGNIYYQTNVDDGLTTTDSIWSVINTLRGLKDSSTERLLYDKQKDTWFLENADNATHIQMFVKAFKQGNYPEFSNEREAEQYFQENYLADDQNLLQFLAQKYDRPEDAKQAMEHTLGTDEYTHAYLRDNMVIYSRYETDLSETDFPVNSFDHYKVEYDENNNREIKLVKKATKGLTGLEPQTRVSGKGKDFRGFYAPELRLISLAQNADPTTLAHELAHDWMQQFFRHYRSGKASESFMKSWGAVEKALGITENDITVPDKASEAFARAYEGWILNNKDWAKNIDIEDKDRDKMIEIFKRYQGYLTDVYEDLNNPYFLETWGETGKLKPELQAWFDKVTNPTDLIDAQVQTGKITPEQAQTKQITRTVNEVVQAVENEFTPEEKEEIAAVERMNDTSWYEVEGGNKNSLQNRLSGLARDIDANNIALKRYDTHRDMLEVAKAADDFVRTRRDEAINIINGIEPEKEGLYASDLYTALERFAVENNNVDLALELTNSKVAQDLAKEWGQRIAGFRNFTGDGDFDVISQLKSLDNKFKKDYDEKGKQRVETAANEYVEELNKADDLQDVDAFLDSIKCQ